MPTARAAIIWITIASCIGSTHALAQTKLDKKAVQASNELRRKSVFPVEDDPKLPRVLLIGDSNTMGYTVPLRELLKDKANVHYPDENCHDTRLILEQLDKYLGDKPWDVIHLNCGIHDATLKDENGVSIKAGGSGKPMVPLDEYRENLEKIVVRLKETGAVVIWCTSTPLDEIFPHRKPTDIDHYNAAANEVMRKLDIPVTDLNRIILERGKPKWLDGAHFTVEGYYEIAADIAPPIVEALDKRTKK